jgi:TRAP-type C4-dicarboxylate transport system permease small subunit
MDFFSIMLPSPWKETINFIATASFIGVCLFVIPKSFMVTEMMVNLNQLSVVAEAPMSIPHSALLIGFVLMLIAVAYRFRSHVMGTLETEMDEIVHEYGEDQE